MKGIELARGYYKEYGEPMLKNDFADILPLAAVGFVGSGSEHFGFDDEISRDHDFEPGFCIFLPGEDIVDRRRAFQLERAYAKLPKEYMGVKRQPVSPVGGSRNGVMRTAGFYLKAVGSADGIMSPEQWLSIPDYALADAVNGEVFFDEYGEFSQIRERLKNMPGDIRLKRIAGNLLIMAQSGQYNFLRCLEHGEPEAAQLACGEFVNAAMRVLFLLRGSYMPFYKWSFRALRGLGGCDSAAGKLSLLLKGNNADRADADAKYAAVEDVAAMIIGELVDSGLTKAVCGDLEKHAYSVNDMISNGTVRNMSILAGVN